MEAQEPIHDKKKTYGSTPHHEDSHDIEKNSDILEFPKNFALSAAAPNPNILFILGIVVICLSIPLLVLSFKFPSYDVSTDVSTITDTTTVTSINETLPSILPNQNSGLESNQPPPPRNSQNRDNTKKASIPTNLVEVAAKPHVVLVIADDLSWNSLGYVDEKLSYATPVLTSLAQQGIIMNNFYAQEVCTPSRASLLTGRYPLSVGMQYGMIQATAEWGLPLDETTIAQVLKDEGYHTHLLGKWHLGYFSPKYLPTARGFDDFVGFLNGEEYYWSKRSPDYDDYVDFMEADTNCYHAYDGSDKEEYSTTLFTKKAINIVENHPIEEPLFLVMSYQAVHDPFVDTDQYLDGMPDSYLPSDVLSTIESTIVGKKRQEYVKSLYMMDQSVGQLKSALETKGMMDNTYMIFLSDNGGCVFGGGKNGPLRGSKGALFEGGVKVNSFVYSPLLNLNNGVVYNGLMHVSDWFPTILSVRCTIHSQGRVRSRRSGSFQSLGRYQRCTEKHYALQYVRLPHGLQL